MNAVKTCNPWNPKNRIISESEIRGILTTYGVTEGFQSLYLFKPACVHTSYVDKSETWLKQDEPMILAEKPPNCLQLQAADNEELE